MIEVYDLEYTKKLIKTKLEASGAPMILFAKKIDKAIDQYYAEGFRILKTDDATKELLEQSAGKKITLGGK